MMNEENKELEAQEEARVEEIQEEEAPVEEARVEKVREEEAPVEEAPVEEVREEEAPKPTMDAIAEEAKELKEKVASYSKTAKESISADYKKGGVEAMVKNKYFWIVLGIVLVILVLLGVIG